MNPAGSIEERPLPKIRHGSNLLLDRTHGRSAKRERLYCASFAPAHCWPRSVHLAADRLGYLLLLQICNPDSEGNGRWISVRSFCARLVTGSSRWAFRWPTAPAET